MTTVTTDETVALTSLPESIFYSSLEVAAYNMALDSLSTLCGSYVVDYSADRFHLPIPGQICYFIRNTETDIGESFTEKNFLLVKCVAEARNIIKKKTFGILSFTLQQLSESDGTVKQDESGVDVPQFSASFKLDIDNSQPLGRPWFVRATRVVLTPPLPSLADVFHVAALANAKNIEIQQQLAALAKSLLPTNVSTMQEQTSIDNTQKESHKNAQ